MEIYTFRITTARKKGEAIYFHADLHSLSPDPLWSVDCQGSPRLPDVPLTLGSPPSQPSSPAAQQPRMPAIDEETAELREELARLAERVRSKQEEVRDNTELGKPGSK